MEYRPWPCEMLWTTRSSISGWLRLDISTTDLMAAGFGMTGYDDRELEQMFGLLRRRRVAAGDFTG